MSGLFLTTSSGQKAEGRRQKATSRFGLYHVDFQSMGREAKQCALGYKSFLGGGDVKT